MAQVMRPEREEEIMAQVGEEIKAADGSGKISLKSFVLDLWIWDKERRKARFFFL